MKNQENDKEKLSLLGIMISRRIINKQKFSRNKCLIWAISDENKIRKYLNQQKKIFISLDEGSFYWNT